MGQQLLFFVEFNERKPGMSVCIAKRFPVSFKEQDVKRVWTLLRHTDPNVRPELPFVPVHHKNAFIEDYMHDWNIWNGEFKYASRATDQDVWILVEMK